MGLVNCVLLCFQACVGLVNYVLLCVLWGWCCVLACNKPKTTTVVVHCFCQSFLGKQYVAVAVTVRSNSFETTMKEAMLRELCISVQRFEGGQQVTLADCHGVCWLHADILKLPHQVIQQLIAVLRRWQRHAFTGARWLVGSTNPAKKHHPRVA